MAAVSPKPAAAAAPRPATATAGWSNLTIAELKEICSAHGLTKSGTKEVLIARQGPMLPVKSFTVEKLKEICRSCKLTVGGTREQLVERLVASP